MFKKEFGFTLAEGATHVNSPQTKAKFGFTLAEVLITLGIIGVVAAITIPNLIANQQKKAIVSQVMRQTLMRKVVLNLRQHCPHKNLQKNISNRI